MPPAEERDRYSCLRTNHARPKRGVRETGHFRRPDSCQPRNLGRQKSQENRSDRTDLNRSRKASGPHDRQFRSRREVSGFPRRTYSTRAPSPALSPDMKKARDPQNHVPVRHRAAPPPSGSRSDEGSTELHHSWDPAPSSSTPIIPTIRSRSSTVANSIVILPLFRPMSTFTRVSNRSESRSARSFSAGA